MCEMEFTERQSFVLGQALAYFLSNVDDYNEYLSDIEAEKSYFIEEDELREIIKFLKTGE